MHPFATDSPERKNVTFTLALVSVLATWGLNRLVQLFHIAIPWWVGAPSVLGVFYLLYEVFDKWCWHWPVWRKLGVVKLPDLDGKWDGCLSSSFDEHGKSYPIRVVVHQDWTHISVLLETEQSESHSLTASILVQQAGGISLSYQYHNDPKPVVNPRMQPHRGTAVVKLKANGGLLEGEYYTGRGRQNYGTVRLWRTGDSRP